MRVTRFLPRIMPAALIALVGCGQTGALYLPDAGVETPVEVRAPASPTASDPAPAPAPSHAPTPAPEVEDEEEKSDLPKGL